MYWDWYIEQFVQPAMRNLLSEAVCLIPAEKSKTYQFNLPTLAHVLGVGYCRIGTQGMCKWTACLHPELWLSTLPVMCKWTVCLHPETCCLYIIPQCASSNMPPSRDMSVHCLYTITGMCNVQVATCLHSETCPRWREDVAKEKIRKKLRKESRRKVERVDHTWVAVMMRELVCWTE